MKWFFALNGASLSGRRGEFYTRPFWENMILAAVSSAQRHTDLSPHLVWDGGDDPFLDRLMAMGVTVVPHRVTFYDELEAHGGDSNWLTVAAGAFLRSEIPLLSDDELVLYTDCDILFLRPFEVPFAPRVFACAPEFVRGANDEMNTGVMLMNLPAMRESLPDFQAFIRERASGFRNFDQEAYRLFYGDDAELLPDEYNWKPYWGLSPDASIVHFHGPKPDWSRQMLREEQHAHSSQQEELENLLRRDTSAYAHYVGRWEDAALSAGARLDHYGPPVQRTNQPRLIPATVENFTVRGYLSANPDLREHATTHPGFNPRRHLLERGLYEGRFVETAG